MQQLLTAAFEGQLANQTLIIFKLLRFAKLHDIPRSQIVINASAFGSSGMYPRKYGKKCEKGFLLNRREFFAKIGDILLSENEFHRKTTGIVFTEPLSEELAEEQWKLGKSVCLNKSLVYPANHTERAWLREWFTNRELFDTERQNLIAEGVDPGRAVALHVRRMDFQDYHDGKFLQSKKCLQEKIDSVPVSDQVVIFSDDQPWCKDNLTRNAGGDLIFNQSGADFQDLIRLSLCKNLIRNPGSSFSNLAYYLHCGEAL